MLRRVFHSGQQPPAGLNRVQYSNAEVLQPDVGGVRLSPIADFTLLKDVCRDRSASDSHR